MSKSRKEAYELFIAQAVCSTIKNRSRQQKEAENAGRSDTEDDCPCSADFKIDSGSASESNEDVS